MGLAISPEELNAVAAKIYSNECAGKPENLVHWNQGEECLSLGIGHFIWYPEGARGPFEEEFPLFIQYCKNQGITLIPFLQNNTSCPWKTRESFLEDKNSPAVSQLRTFLLETRALQAKFIAERLSRALVKMTATLDQSKKEAVTKRFNSLAAMPQGLYALLDYVNFKGEGVATKERYNNQGWGLLQVLEEMPDEKDLLASFRTAAKAILARRVANAPPERNEARWLPGWNKRIDTYIAD